MMDDRKKFLKVSSDPSFLMLVTDAAAAGDYVRGLADGGVVVRTLRGRKMRTLQGVMDEVGAALQFPSYFGENWPALDECLSDLEWMLPAVAFVVLIQDSEQVLVDDDGAKLQTFVEIFADAMSTFAEPIALGETWDRPAVPFHLVLQTEADSEKSVLLRWTTAGASITVLTP